MTRFMMSLDDAVNLVLYAFKNGKSGEIFVQKSPAATIEVLAHSLKELYSSSVPIKIIGIRHGEKIYETLVSSEEMLKAEDLGEYFRIKSDNRTLDYEKYIDKGLAKEKISEEYHSHNTKRLNIEETKKLLMSLNFINKDFK
jgi:UDP-glucose 4-epimerase